MKKTFLFVITFIFNLSAFSQDKSVIENKENLSKLKLVLTPKLGFGKLYESGNATLNGFVNGGELLISYKLDKKKNIQTGVGYFQFDGNRVISGNSSSLTNSYLQIPLNFNSNYVVLKDNGNNHIMLTTDIGIYANNLLKQKTETSSLNSLGWNFGFSAGLGVKFILSDLFDLGLGFQSQSDLSKAKKNNIETKIENLNTIYFRLEYKL